MQHRVTAIGDDRPAAAGCLMVYSLSHLEQTERLAAIIDQVLIGRNPADIPFELPIESKYA